MVSIDSTRRTSLDIKALNSYEEANQPTINPTGSHEPEKKANPPKQSVSLKGLALLILDHWFTTTFMLVLTVYALFGDSFRALLTSQDADDGFYIVTIICISFFTLEIIVASFVKEDYFLSFFFWLDVISTISLITDIGWAWDAMTGQDRTGKASSTSSQFSQASRASRAGTRAARIVRLIRVIRLVRIAKLYKLSQVAKEKLLKKDEILLKRGRVAYRGNENPLGDLEIIESEAFINEDSEINSVSANFSNSHANRSRRRTTRKSSGAPKLNPRDSTIQDLEVPKESKVGKKLSELTTKRVIILSLLTVVILPLFESQLYYDDNDSYELGLHLIMKEIDDQEAATRVGNFYVKDHKNIDTPIILVIVGEYYNWSSDTNPADLRAEELGVYTLSEDYMNTTIDGVSMFDLRNNTKRQAGLDIGITLFVCLVLSFFSLAFSKDAQDLIIEPLESMILTVQKISENPVKAAQEQEVEEVTRNMALTKSELLKEKTKKNANLETKILEETFIKIGALLALGFGEAGSEIIAKNVNRSGGEIDPLIPGKKRLCIFGFCDIRQFSEATEILQKDVMIFVNEIAKIVHQTVNNYSGSANKNIGEAFLIVWKFHRESVLEDSLTGEVSLIDNHHTNDLADMAVVAYLKTIAEINKSPKTLAYQKHPGLTAKMPGFCVKMGFGLHQGWAIEGAIGSEFKIDASYLSPNVNLASRLEAATRQFGVHILVSDALYNICSSQTQKNFRKVDRVTVKGSKVPIELYTVDLDLTALEVGTDTEDTFTDLKEARAFAHIKRERLNDAVKHKNYRVYRLFTDDKDLRAMKKNISKHFMHWFSIALEEYLKGDWSQAAIDFSKAQVYKNGKDGPTEVILEFMKENNNVPPPDWSGYRILHDK
ncbi:unnamed protein product [Blepharisma stoltei]|uniref:Guanylate cyclase domain-containing protein n=1 Tax=Blepharisma stoltei TaxID=1481888 RepID=A0AAU9IEJ3_9CILI|nr:unnamed protein product [Blepharisma stoltei]